MIDALDITPYRMPLVRPWRSARGTLTERTGWLVCVRAHGHAGYGDCAPLPEAGTEEPGAALAALERWSGEAPGLAVETLRERLERDRGSAPAARYALECALLDMGAQRAEVPLRRWLNPQAFSQVEVNDALGPLHEATPALVRASCRAGFRVLKLKVGLEPPEAELRRLGELRPHLSPGAAFRLDANGAWGVEDAARVVQGLNALPVESLEEPLHAPRAASLRRLQATARFPLALDESLHLSEAAIDLAALPVRRVVLKPALVGGLWRTLRLAHRLGRLGVQVVTTSLVETAAGLWPTLQLAAALGSPYAHGLATSPWLARDLGTAPVAQRGRVLLPERPGSGFTPAAPGPRPRRKVRNSAP